MLKKIAKITGISLAVLIVILFVAPFIFKGKIIAIAKEQINKASSKQIEKARKEAEKGVEEGSAQAKKGLEEAKEQAEKYAP